MTDCFFHTGRPAVARCKQCGKPLCSECRIIKPEGIFCSEKCYEAYKVFADRAEEIEAKRSKSSGIKSLVKLIIFLVVLYLIYILVKRYFL
jgi:hypothetical protein